MQESIRKIYIDKIKSGLANLKENHHLFFKRMYSHNNLDEDINTVVDNLPDEKLDHVLRQVESTKI